MVREYTIRDNNWYIDFALEDDLTTVHILDLHTGNRARAHALRWNGDRYDEVIGMNVAYSRALQRLSRKNEKHFISQTHPVGG